MATSTISQSFKEDREIWQNLRNAIANSSGFQRWQKENHLDLELEKSTLDEKVRYYLRSTLETLAY